MARRWRLTDRAKKSRRRRVVCGHFRTQDMKVRSAQGVMIVTICADCHMSTSTRAMTREEKLAVVKESRKLRVVP